jgi:hypothetical protein
MAQTLARKGRQFPLLKGVREISEAEATEELLSPPPFGFVYFPHVSPFPEPSSA